jgi:choline-sulfatase
MANDRPAKPLNLLLLITDQERATQHFPPGWERGHLRNFERLKRHGVNFTRAYTNACMCSPSRSTLFSGLYVAQHQVTDTLSWNGIYSPTETVLDPNLPNLAKMLRAAGYQVHYRGKWHMSKGASQEWSLTAADVAIYGFEGWQPPDSGEDTLVTNFGGGYANHDARYLQEAVEFLSRVDPNGPPFCLVLCLVNPHDVLSYPKTYQYGYGDDDLAGPIELPATWDEDLRANHKPSAQPQLIASAAAGLGPLPGQEDKLKYLNFYANLISKIDGQLTPIVNLLYHDDGSPTDLGRSTLVVRTADHGELGMTHGGMRQKAFNFYEEATRIPLLFSNPALFPEARETAKLASLIDLMPTFAEVLGAPPPSGLGGKSLAPVLRDPASPGVQDEIIFTFDDVRASAGNRSSAVKAANRIRAIHEDRYKYARYFEANGTYPAQHEMYDLLNDPNETENLAWPGHPRHHDPEVRRERERLANRLAVAEHEIVKKHENA